MKRFLIMLVASISFVALLAAPASSQFGGLMKKKESGGGASKADVELQQEKLVKSFLLAQKKLHHAQRLILEAGGKKDEAIEAQEDADTYSGKDQSKDLVERTVNRSKENQKQIDELDLKTLELSAEGKKLVAQSLVPYAQSVASTAAMVIDAKSLAEGIKAQLKAAGFAGAMKVKKTFDVGLYLAPKIPGLSGGQLTQIKKMIDYARKHGLPIDEKVADQF